MRRFHLVGLYSQMPFGLNGTRGYKRLAAGDEIAGQSDTFAFRSWIGCEFVFTYPAPGDLNKPGDLRRGWSSYDPSADEGDDEL